MIDFAAEPEPATTIAARMASADAFEKGERTVVIIAKGNLIDATYLDPGLGSTGVYPRGDRL
jgi:hypothetical protein